VSSNVTPSKGTDRGTLAKRAGLALLIVIALGAVIFAATALSSPHRAPSNDAAVASVEANALAAQAEQLAASGDTAGALTAARKALALDPKNAKALALVTQLTKKIGSGGGANNGSGDGTSTTPGTETTTTPGSGTATDYAGFDKPVSQLRLLLPVAVNGFDKGTYDTQDKDVSVPFSPLTESPAVRLVVFTVHDQGSHAGANAFVDRVSKVAFPNDAAQIAVGGGSAYFGTFEHLVTVAFVRGRYAYEVTLTSVPDQPVKLKALATNLASLVPTRVP
jgi:hypothetical protein